MSDRNTSEIKNKEEEELKSKLKSLSESIGYTSIKIQLLNALIETREGTPRDIAKEAKLERTTHVYDFLHELAKDVEGIEETEIGKKRYKFYIKDLRAVYESIGKIAIKQKEDEIKKREDELETVKDRVQEIVNLAENIFVLKTGVASLAGDFSPKKIGSVIELENEIEDITNNAERRFLFLGRSGKRVNPNVMKRLKKKTPSFDCRIITVQEEKESKYLERIFGPPEKIEHRYLTRFDEEGKLWYPIRFIVYDYNALIFEWEEKKGEKRIKWAFEIEDKYFSTLLAMAFDYLWKSHTE